MEKWVKDITGNQQLSFRSGYGRDPFTRQPQLFDSLTGKKVLNPPGAQWQSLKSVITAMGNDPARYIEVAIETLGLENVISSPVIISKLGNGFSDSRGTNEITYVAFVQFVDERIRTNNQGKFRTLAMTLRGVVKPPLNFIELDARVAAEVTEIIRRVVSDKII